MRNKSVDLLTHHGACTLTEDQLECMSLFSDLVGGEHHMLGTVREFGRGLLWNMRCRSLSTFDFDYLTRLVVMAHDRCIRVEIIPSGPGMIGITAHKRHTREGEMYQRHPTIETAVLAIRNGRRSA